MIFKRRKRAIAVVLAVLTLIGGFSYQWHKIKTLEREVFNKQQIEMRLNKTESIETYMYEETIREKFNELKTYKVLDGKLNFKHTYNYTDDVILGLEKKIKITAFNDVYFQYDLDLSTAQIYETDKKIVVKIDKPYLNEETLHVVKNSTQIVKSATTYSILSTKKDTQTAMQYYYESLEDRAIKDITTLYETEKQNHLKYNAKKEVKKLVETFVDKKVVVKYK